MHHFECFMLLELFYWLRWCNVEKYEFKIPIPFDAFSCSRIWNSSKTNIHFMSLILLESLKV